MNLMQKEKLIVGLAIIFLGIIGVLINIFIPHEIMTFGFGIFCLILGLIISLMSIITKPTLKTSLTGKGFFFLEFIGGLGGIFLLVFLYHRDQFFSPFFLLLTILVWIAFLDDLWLYLRRKKLQNAE